MASKIRIAASRSTTRLRFGSSKARSPAPAAKMTMSGALVRMVEASSETLADSMDWRMGVAPSSRREGMCSSRRMTDET